MPGNGRDRTEKPSSPASGAGGRDGREISGREDARRRGAHVRNGVHGAVRGVRRRERPEVVQWDRERQLDVEWRITMYPDSPSRRVQVPRGIQVGAAVPGRREAHGVDAVLLRVVHPARRRARAPGAGSPHVTRGARCSLSPTERPSTASCSTHRPPWSARQWHATERLPDSPLWDKPTRTALTA